MPVLRDPVVTLEDVRLRKITLSSLDLELSVRVDNPHLLGVTLRELPFTVLCSSGRTVQQLASGNPGRVKIAANGSTVLRIPVTSRNVALIGALATFITKGGVQVTIRGTATIDVRPDLLVDPVREDLAGNHGADYQFPCGEEVRIMKRPLIGKRVDGGVTPTPPPIFFQTDPTPLPAIGGVAR